MFLSRCGSAAFGSGAFDSAHFFGHSRQSNDWVCGRGGIQEGFFLRFRGRGEGKKESSFM